MNLCLFWQIEMRDFTLKVNGVLYLVITIGLLKVSIVAHSDGLKDVSSEIISLSFLRYP